jgi:hypothetical protein
VKVHEVVVVRARLPELPLTAVSADIGGPAAACLGVKLLNGKGPPA